MKMVTTKRIGWVAPIMALTLGITSMNVATAQNKPKAKATKAIKTEKTKSKTIYGTFSQASATGVKIKSNKEEMSANLVPATIFWRYQRGVSAADLKVGETVRMNLPGTDDMGRVESLSPLTLKFGGNATLSYGQDSKVKFERISKITATDVVAGQKGKVAGNVYPDGRIEAREVWVNVEPGKKVTKKKN